MPETARLRPTSPPRPLSSFVGRRREIEELDQALVHSRLVTVTGPGGCGKTRLAIELAVEIGGRFPDGVAFADLAVVTDSAVAAEAVAAAVGVGARPGGDMAELIGDARLLLVIDSAEHVVDQVAPIVEGLLDRCPCLRVLVTSRQPLHLHGEMCWGVPPLELPPADAELAPELLSGYDAVRLFVVRAAERHAAFRLTPRNAGLVVEICRRLDGIPLALELASARVTSLALSEIASRLEDSCRLLSQGSRSAVPRHRTLKATIDWSYELLADDERRLLRRLSVFTGSFDLGAVEAVCAGPDLPGTDVADVLHPLVEKSLIVVHPSPDGDLRYGLMEVVRQYARERLAEADELDVQASHARHYAELIDRVAEDRDRDFQRCLRHMSDEYDNARAALDWAARHDVELEAVLVNGLCHLWMSRGWVGETRRWTEAALGRPPCSARRRALLHLCAAHSAYVFGDHTVAAAHTDAAARLLPQVDDVRLARSVLISQGVTRCLNGDITGAEESFLQAIDLFHAHPSPRGHAGTLNYLANMWAVTGRPRDALAEIDRALAMQRQMEYEPVRLAQMLHTRGMALLALRRADDGWATFMRALSYATESNNHEAAMSDLIALACLAAERGRPALCLELMGAARRCVRLVGADKTWFWDIGPWKSAGATEQASRSTLGEAAAEAALARGAEMDLRAALELARRAGEIAAEARPSPRRLEVVRLVAAGLSNKEIARRMSISVRTVDAHLEHLRNQFGLQNRAQIVAWAAARGLLPAGEQGMA